MFFSASKPVFGKHFFNREKELSSLEGLIRSLKKGVPRYAAIMGMRKVGKTSLIEEFRRLHREKAVIPILDCSAGVITAETFFEDFAVAIIDEFLISEGYSAETGLMNGTRHSDAEFMMTLGRIQSLHIESLNKVLAAILNLKKKIEPLRDQYSVIADLPEELARERSRKFLVVLDEFHECNKLNAFKSIKTNIGDIFSFFRSKWQRHQNVAYLISGSEISLLSRIIHSESSPFFQHFKSLTVREFSKESAESMILELFRKSGFKISVELLHQLAELTNGHPFYLQVLGEELCTGSREGMIHESDFKAILHETLFEVSGRLYLYFSGQHEKYIRSSSSLEKVLISIASGFHRVSETAKDLGLPTGYVSNFIRRLMDMDILVKENGAYQIRDPLYALWISGAKSHRRTYIGPYVLGSHAEQKTSEKLSKEGFRLIYQSKASRGAFDLLAILNSFSMGLQIKKIKKYPYYLPRNDALNMKHWGKRLSWTPVLCLYQDEDNIRYFPLESLIEKQKSFKADHEKGYEKLLEIAVKFS